MLERRPEEVIRKAVKGMLPRNRLARQQLTKLKVYAGPDHPHAAQQPKPMEITDLIDDENRDSEQNPTEDLRPTGPDAERRSRGRGRGPSGSDARRRRRETPLRPSEARGVVAEAPRTEAERRGVRPRSAAEPRRPAADGGCRGGRRGACAEEAAIEPRLRRPEAEEKKKDVIPGADLEPIAVEPEERPLSAEEQARREAEEEERAQREAELAGERRGGAARRQPRAGEDGERRPLPRHRQAQELDRPRHPAARRAARSRSTSATLEEFFPRPLHQTMARQPLAITGYEGNVDVRVRVHGGGISGQAGAVRHGIARALTEIDPELRGELKRRGFLTRDARVKERRKAGLKKARKRPQFSKR